MKKRMKQLIALSIMIGGLFTQQAGAAKLYTETVAGGVALPAGTYGSITTTDPSSGTLLAAHKIINGFAKGEIINIDIPTSQTDIVTHTVSFWYKTTTLANKLIYKAATEAGNHWGYELNLTLGGELELKSINGGGVLTTVGAKITTDTWVHVGIAITSSAPTTRTFDAVFYVNGDVATTSGSAPSSGVNGKVITLVFPDGGTYAGIYVDDTALDAATVIATAKSSLAPPVVKSAHLDGNANSFISIPDHNDFHTGTAGYNNKSETMSAMVWVKTTATDVTIFNKRGPEDSSSHMEGYVVKLDATGKVTLQYSGWDKTIVTSTATVNDDQWHHIAIMATGKIVKIFIDGIEEISQDVDADDGTNNTMSIVLGAEQDGSKLFPGNLKDFRIYQASTVGSGSSITAGDVLNIMADSAGSYSMTNLKMLVRLALKGDLTNTGTLGTTLNGTTTGAVTYNNNFVYPAPQPVMPKNVSLALGTLKTVNATWDVTTGSVIDGFKWEFATDAGFKTGVITGTEANPTLTTATATGLNEGTEYFFRVCSYTTGNPDEDWVVSSNSATTLTTTMPKDVTLALATVSTVQAIWDITVGTGNDGFKWELRTGSYDGTLVDSATVGNSIRAVTITKTLADSTPYFFRVCSYTGTDDEAWVNSTTSVKTLKGPAYGALGLSDKTTDNQVNCGVISELQGVDSATVELWYRHGGTKKAGPDWDANEETVWSNGDIKLSYVPTTLTLGKSELKVTVGGAFGIAPEGLGYVIPPTGAYQNTETTSNHVAVVYDGTGATNADRLKVYFNGSITPLVLSFTGTVPATIPSASTPFTIGAHPSNFDGIVDEFRVWKTARTADEVNTFYDGIFESPKSMTDLVCYYNFDQVTGSSVPDLSGGTDYSASVSGTTAPLWYDSNAAGISSNTVMVKGGGRLITSVMEVEVVRTGTLLTWTVNHEIGIIKYQVVVDGEVIGEITPDGSKSYSTTVPADGKVELVIVDKHGSQSYFPSNGNGNNLVTTPYDLQQGWNIVAITGDNANLDSLKSEANGYLWAWNATTSSYVRITGSDKVKATQAIWIHVIKEKRVEVVAEKSTASITLVMGWNLVGPTNNQTIPTEAMSVFDYYDNKYVPITGTDEFLIRGVGYWIFRKI